MCRRISQHYTLREINDLYDIAGTVRRSEPRYNVSPAKAVDAVAALATGNSLIRMRWGFLPWWWRKTAKQVPSNLFNIRAESVAQNPIFRSEFRRNRCIIPTSGYFEWKDTPDGKQPYFIGASDGGVLSIAGMWDAWNDPGTDEIVPSCTIITTDANTFTRAVHHRMPVLLDRADFAPWLSGAAGPELFKPAGEDRLRMWPVSRRVNQASGQDDPTLIDEIAA